MKKLSFVVLSVGILSLTSLTVFSNSDDLIIQNQIIRNEINYFNMRSIMDPSMMPCSKNLACRIYSNPIAFMQPGSTYKNKLFLQNRYEYMSDWSENHCLYAAGINEMCRDGFGKIMFQQDVPAGGLTYSYTHAGSYYYVIN